VTLTRFQKGKHEVRKTRIAVPITKTLKSMVIAIYLAAIVTAALCSAYSLFVVVVGGFMFGLPFLLYPAIPTLINLGYLLLVIGILGARTWRRHMFKTQVWLPVLLALPLIACGNYMFAESLRGF
jgi:hypothetical protein